MVEQDPQFKDHCAFQVNHDITDLLNKDRNGKTLSPLIPLLSLEKVVFSCKVAKFNRFNMKQERDLLFTNLYIYNIKKNSKRCLFNEYRNQEAYLFD
jgi:hypothetical protein